MRTLLAPLPRAPCALALVATLALVACVGDEPTAPVGEPADAVLRRSPAITIGPAEALPLPDGCGLTAATDVNDAGTTVGWAYFCADGRQHGVVWDAAGGWAWLPEPGGDALYPFHVADNGEILAHTQTTAPSGIAQPRFYRIGPSGMVDELELPHDPGAPFTLAGGPSPSGLMVLAQHLPGYVRRFWLWNGRGRLQEIPTPPGTELVAADVNARGEVAVTIRTGDVFRAGVWQRGRGFRTLALLAGASGSVADAIDAAGRVWGTTQLPIPPSCATPGTNTARGTLWSPQGAATLFGGDALACVGSANVTDVDGREIAGGTISYRTAPPNSVAFVATASGAVALAPCALDGVPLVDGCQGRGVSDAGWLVGVYVGAPYPRAVRWRFTVE